MRPTMLRALMLAAVLSLLTLIGRAAPAATQASSLSTTTPTPVETLSHGRPILFAEDQTAVANEKRDALLVQYKEIADAAAAEQAAADQAAAEQAAADQAARKAAAKKAAASTAHTAPAQSATSLSEPADDPGPSGSIEDLIYKVFGENGARAVRVARCESGLNPSARNSSGASGLFQIMLPTHEDIFKAHGWTAADWADPYKNAVVAFDLSGGGTNWGPWSCRG